MKLTDIVGRSPVPGPWEEGPGIPWNEPSFSRRMLEQHLSQEHDRASRRSAIIDGHVRWIHETLLRGSPSRVLDLCCGPGLYTTRLALLGHRCVGVDFSPASIEHARKLAADGGLDVEYIESDAREADVGTGYDLVMLVFGELNVFPPDDARRILRKAHVALVTNGTLLLEPQEHDAVRDTGEAPPTWYASAGGLFSAVPHIVLEENFWDAVDRTATTRFYVVDAASGDVERHAMTTQAYTDAAYTVLLSDAGFEGCDFLDLLPGTPEEDSEGLIAIVARKTQKRSNQGTRRPGDQGTRGRETRGPGDQRPGDQGTKGR
jgi:SAM-dependent methyltransferase